MLGRWGEDAVRREGACKRRRVEGDDDLRARAGRGGRRGCRERRKQEEDWEETPFQADILAPASPALRVRMGAGSAPIRAPYLARIARRAEGRTSTPPGWGLLGESVARLGLRADVAELVDAHGSGPCGGNPVEVQVLSSALPDRRAPGRTSSRRSVP